MDNNENYDEEGIEELSPFLETPRKNGNDEAHWVLSFADIMSLLAAFFMMLYTTNNMQNIPQTEETKQKKEVEKQKQRELEEESLRNALSLLLVQEEQVMDEKERREKVAAFVEKLPDNVSRDKVSEVLNRFFPIDKFKGEGEERLALLNTIFKRLKEIKDLTKVVDLIMKEDHLRLIVQEKELFDSGSAVIKKSFMNKLAMLMKEMEPFKGDLFIEVEGHTDSVPIGRTYRKTYPSNWELSAARAISVIKYMGKVGIEKDRLKAVGYADTRPRFPELSESGQILTDNRSKNRRIAILIYQKTKL